MNTQGHVERMCDLSFDAIGTHDLGRTKIMIESIRLIDKTPDILNYIEIPEL